MDQIIVDVYDKKDINDLIDHRLQEWNAWAVNITEIINTIQDRLTTLDGVNVAQNKRINALKSRVLALEEQTASGVDFDVQPG